MEITVDVGYALGQLAKALATAGGHADAVTRERAEKKVARWRQVLAGMEDGTIAVGSRTPVQGAPAWATLEVAHGGFATGNLLAGGPLRPHEAALLRAGPDDRPDESRARRTLNLHYLSDAGRAELARMLASGCYRVEVPEEGALLAAAWLLDHGHADRAGEILDAIVAFTDRLRFYPVPAGAPLSPSAMVKLRTTSETADALKALRPRRQVATMNEALRLWAPQEDRTVSLFLETVEGETPHLRVDASGALVRRPDGQPFVVGGWPCKRYPAGWADRAKALLDDYAAARADHRLSGKPDRPGETFAVLRGYIDRCTRDPASLTGRDVGMIRKTLASFVTRHGVPGSEAHAALRARQARDAALPLHQDLARVLADRLSGFPKEAGLPSLDAVLVPVSDAEAAQLGVAAGARVPPSLARRLDRCLEAPIDELVRRRVIPSSEVLAIVLPQITSQVGAAGFDDPDLARLYGAIYAAFRRRRSLLLLNLESQVRIDELPWVAALAPLRTGKLDEGERAKRTLEQVATLALTSFPRTIVPNKLLQELRALATSASLPLPLVDELAADIFMGAFSGKFVDAAKIAARTLAGSLYARYYDLPIDAVLRIQDVKKEKRHAAASSADFARLCTDRAALGAEGARFSVARNGKIIEQEQILTTHNLAALVDVLGLAPAVQPRAVDLAEQCFRSICKELQITTGGHRARLHRVKNSAYAWRQMVFFLSLAGDDALQAFLTRAAEILDAQREPFRRRFRPALDGLAIAAWGGDLSAAEQRGEARRFLGWSTGGHWLLAEG
jgi:hypothetical protein